MERYFNTLKNECTNLYEFTTEEALYATYLDSDNEYENSVTGYTDVDTDVFVANERVYD